MQLAQRTWYVVGLALFLIAATCGACGLLVGALPLESSEYIPSPESTSFWITRGCLIGPAFAVAFLAYMAFLAGRRRGRPVRCAELVAALGAALALIPILAGLAFALQPAPTGADPVFGLLLCVLPGLFILAVTGLFWAVTIR